MTPLPRTERFVPSDRTPLPSEAGRERDAANALRLFNEERKDPS